MKCLRCGCRGRRKMKVFLAIRCEAYEPDVILGIFDNPIKAQKRLEEDRSNFLSNWRNTTPYDWEVEEWEVK